MCLGWRAAAVARFAGGSSTLVLLRSHDSALIPEYGAGNPLKACKGGSGEHTCACAGGGNGALTGAIRNETSCGWMASGDEKIRDSSSR
jgi:hypothetical protein